MPYVSGADDSGAAVMAARHAQAAWAAQPLSQRLAVMRRLRHSIARQAETVARSVTAVTGWDTAETLAAEVLPLADACRFLERQAPHLLAPRRWLWRGRPWWLQRVTVEIRREPMGVVLLIAPSNYPLLLPGVQTLQALVAGNAVLLKPGQGGWPVACALAAHLEAAGLERGLLHVLPETPVAAHAAMAAGIDKVILTGSATTGAAVLNKLASHLTPAVMELSGCDAAFVRADADVDLVAQALQFSWRLYGSATCIAPRRVFVAPALAGVLEARLTRLANAMAPCAVAPAAAALVQELVAAACAEGARRLAGDFLPDGTMTPVLLTAATPAMRLLHTDLFAPVLALVTVRNDDEALAAAAQCPYALGATVFGAAAGARTLAYRVRAGVVLVNDVIVPAADPRLPFGGRGRSGFGVTRGAEGLLELTCIKAVAVRGGRWRPHFEPPRSQDVALFRAYIAAAHGGRLGERMRAAVVCLQGLGRRLWHA
jgi:acyl-CoA reductase-like NAD-dependent aldehyde dehydrogenase